MGHFQIQLPAVIPAAALAAGLGWTAFGVAAAWTLLQAGRATPGRQSSPLWHGLLLLGLFALRWPRLLAPHEFSPDESQSLAGALTLRQDPRFWVSVDGATAGPLHFFAQLPAAGWLPATSAYAGARATGLLLVFGTLAAAGSLIRRARGPLTEQIVLLGTLAAYAACPLPDLQHLSTEIVAMFLVTLALAIGFRTDAGAVSWRWRLAGLLLGAVPLAKLQAAPLAAAAGGAILLAAGQTERRTAAAALVTAALAPLLVTAGYLSAQDAWSDALIPYLLNNVGYVQDVGIPLPLALAELGRTLWEDGYLVAWSAAAALAVAILRLRAAGPARRADALAWLSRGLFLVGVACVLLPRRPYSHYLYLTLAPAMLLVAGELAGAGSGDDAGPSRRRRGVTAVALALFILPVAGLHATRPDAFAWLARLFNRWHQENVELAALIRPHQQAGDTLAIWGSRSDLYVSTGLPQAIPQAHTQTQLGPGAWQRHFLRVYAERFAANRPAFFVDAVGPGNFLFEDRAFGHESFPPLRTGVQAGYTLLRELHGTRVYVRNDRLRPSGAANSAAP